MMQVVFVQREPHHVLPERVYVFGEGEGPFSGFSNAREALEERMAEEKTSVKDWVPHDFRRTFNSISGEKLDMPPHIGEAMLNHISSIESGKGFTITPAMSRASATRSRLGTNTSSALLVRAPSRAGGSTRPRCAGAEMPLVRFASASTAIVP